MQQEAGQYQLGGGYFTYKLNDSEYSEEIKDVQAWLSEMQTHGGDSEFNLTIKLPTEYTVTEEDVVELGDGWLFSIVSPFYQLYMSFDTIISFTYQIGDGEIVSVDANNIVEIVEIMGNIQLDAMLPIKFTNIKYGKVIACEGDTNVITRIGDEAFANCSNLTNISIPNSITYIGDDVFRNCNNLKYNENNNGKYLGNKENPYLVLVDVIDTNVSEFSISDSCQIIYGYAFQNRSNLTEITLPSSLKSIGNYAFYGCSSLTEITLPSSLTSIGGDAFYGCSNLTEITLPASLISIGDFAFGSCSSLATVTFAGDSQLASIGTYAFYVCSSLTSITIPASVISIGSSAFDGCFALAIVINNSTLPIAVDSNYGYVGYYAKEVVNNGATAQGRIEIIDNVQYYINDTTGEFIALAPAISRNAITSISLADGTTEINQHAFSGCSNLETVTFAEGSQLKSIGGDAFEGCSALQSIELPSSLTSIGDYAFRDCISLTEITLPNSLTSIGSDAFYYCTSLTSITIPEGVTSIGSWAFRNCTSLATVTFAQGSQLESIGDYAFSSCSNLTEITLPSSLKSIGDSAFFGCSNLNTVTIESDDIYKAVDSSTDIWNQAGGLLVNATTVKVLKTIDDGSNTYLSSTGGFTLDKTSDPTYNIYTR